MLKVSWAHPCYSSVLFIQLRDRATLVWMEEEKNVHLEIGNLKQTEFQRLKTEERKAEDKM